LNKKTLKENDVFIPQFGPEEALLIWKHIFAQSQR